MLQLWRKVSHYVQQRPRIRTGSRNANRPLYYVRDEEISVILAIISRLTANEIENFHHRDAEATESDTSPFVISRDFSISVRVHSRSRLGLNRLSPCSLCLCGEFQFFAGYSFAVLVCNRRRSVKRAWLRRLTTVCLWIPRRRAIR